jgi:hypothetical protein
MRSIALVPHLGLYYAVCIAISSGAFDLLLARKSVAHYSLDVLPNFSSSMP